ncbi:MAG: hemolysin family protein [Oscillospiraceae bacterium]|nr:hemolysin family protein [Oscillospiraceae bacterium]
MTSPYYYVVVVIFIMLSAFSSGAEMAYSSANRMRLESIGESGNKAARLACRIYDSYDDMLSSVLILNDLVNIGASSLVSIMAIEIAADGNTALATTLGTILLTVLIIVFGETIPKIAAKKNANNTAIDDAYIVRGLMIVLKPVVFVVVSLIHLIMKPLKGEKPADEQETAVEELFSIIETVEDEGVIDGDRSELLQAALDFSEISASEVMTSRVDMVSIDIDDDWDTILQIIDRSPYSRLPVYEDSIDNIIGILYLNHFFKAITGTEEIDLRPLLIKPCYVYKTVKLPSVLAEMRKSRTHLAIVTDEYGGSMGVVSMEDVLEELVGDIWDETDEVEPEVIEHDGNLFELDGDMNISDFLEMIDRSEDSFETDSATVGGWTIENFGRFPEIGDSFTFENLTITVLEVYGQRVEKVLLHIETKK